MNEPVCVVCGPEIEDAENTPMFICSDECRDELMNIPIWTEEV